GVLRLRAMAVWASCRMKVSPTVPARAGFGKRNEGCRRPPVSPAQASGGGLGGGPFSIALLGPAPRSVLPNPLRQGGLMGCIARAHTHNAPRTVHPPWPHPPPWESVGSPAGAGPRHPPTRPRRGCPGRSPQGLPVGFGDRGGRLV